MARNNKRTLKEIDDEIAKLKAEADAIRESEKAGVVAKIKEAVAYYGITAADIGLSGKRGGKGRSDGKAKPKAAVASRATYKDDAGNSWTGFGRKPKWLVDALNSGKSLEDMRAQVP